MILAYNLSFSDLYEGAKIHYRNSPQGKTIKKCGFVIIICSLIVFALIYLASFSKTEYRLTIDYTTPTILLVIGVLFAFYNQFILRFSMWKFYKKNKDHYQIRKLNITNKNIFMASDKASSILKWNGIEKVIYEKDYILMYMPAGLSYWLIPKHALKNTSQWEELIQLIKSNTKKIT